MPSDKNREAWQSLARRVSQRINLAWWLETTTIPLVILGVYLIARIRSRASVVTGSQ